MFPMYGNSVVQYFSYSKWLFMKFSTFYFVWNEHECIPKKVSQRFISILSLWRQTTLKHLNDNPQYTKHVLRLLVSKSFSPNQRITSNNFVCDRLQQIRNDSLSLQTCNIDWQCYKTNRTTKKQMSCILKVSFKNPAKLLCSINLSVPWIWFAGFWSAIKIGIWSAFRKFVL